MCNRSDIRQFAKEAKEIGVNYIGLCCGNAANYMREIAEVYGRNPEASRFRPDLSQNILFGDRACSKTREHVMGIDDKTVFQEHKEW